MKITYNKLWKLLIDKRLKKVDLQRLTGVSSATITRLSKDQTVNTRVLTRICEVLDCDTSDIMSISKETPNKAKQRSFK
ncbi:MAG: helix-turn-helix transcriptional regulator [Kiritimatiellae bacterium]|nr:helix-turn-helix transcriptional regulator [Kiritimatiellia bacterium]